LIDHLLRWDEKTSAEFRKKAGTTPACFRINAFLAHSGDSWFWCIALFIFWLFAGGDTQRTLAFWGLSIAGTAVLIFFLKRKIQRKRPEGEWGELYRRTDPHSFPSGHAVRAGLIVMLALDTFQPQFALVFIVWALLMIHARVATGVHYLLDIYFGLIFGLLIGTALILLKPAIYANLPILFDRSLWWALLK